MAREKNNVVIIAVYFVMLLFFIFKMTYYAQYVGRFPDESAHIAYIAYLESTNKLIPEFADMRTLKQITVQGGTAATAAKNADINYSGKWAFSSSVNYLGHPPLYYQIMRLSGGVKVENGNITVDAARLRCFNMMLASLAMLLIFYIGYSSIGKNPAFHLLYAAICVSVPMLAYVCAGVNNDTLSIIGAAVFLLGLLRFSEGKRNLPTYMLISAGSASACSRSSRPA